MAFGIVARTPETGYGYIRRGAGSRRRQAHRAFVEKPDQARAREFVASGEYFWNSGMFLFGARRYLDELAQYAPDIADVCARASATVVRDTDFTRVDRAMFAGCRSDSVDYAVMEKTRDAVMVPLDAGWNDVGSWAALHEVLPADEHGNVAAATCCSKTPTVATCMPTAGWWRHWDCMTWSSWKPPMRCWWRRKAKVQDVKKLVARIKAAGRVEHVAHAAPCHRS